MGMAMTPGIVGYSVLIVLGGFAIQCLLAAIFLRLAARFCNVEGATFRRAFATAVAMAIVLTAIEFGLWVVFFVAPAADREGPRHVSLHRSAWEFPLGRRQPAPYEIAALGVALVGSVLASVSLVKSGFQTTIVKAVGVWFFSGVFMAGTVLFLVVLGMLALFAVIALA